MASIIKLRDIYEFVKFAQKVYKFWKETFGKTAENAGKTAPVTNESTIEDVAEINRIFNDFKISIEKQANDIENKLVEEISQYADELCFAVDGGSSLLSKYQINLNRLKSQIDKLKNGITGTMPKEVSKIISLDNPDCKRIVKMLPGRKKEEEFKILLIAALDAGKGAINEKVETIINNIVDDFEFALNDGIELIEKAANSEKQLLTDAEIESNDIVQIKELLKSKASVVTCACELTESIIKEAV